MKIEIGNHFETFFSINNSFTIERREYVVLNLRCGCSYAPNLNITTQRRKCRCSCNTIY